MQFEDQQTQLYDFGIVGGYPIQKIRVQEFQSIQTKIMNSRMIERLFINRIRQATRYKIRTFKHTFHLRLEFDDDPKLASMTAFYGCRFDDLPHIEFMTSEALNERGVIPDGMLRTFGDIK